MSFNFKNLVSEVTTSDRTLAAAVSGWLSNKDANLKLAASRIDSPLPEFEFDLTLDTVIYTGGDDLHDVEVYPVTSDTKSEWYGHYFYPTCGIEKVGILLDESLTDCTWAFDFASKAMITTEYDVYPFLMISQFDDGNWHVESSLDRDEFIRYINTSWKSTWPDEYSSQGVGLHLAVLYYANNLGSNFENKGPTFRVSGCQEYDSLASPSLGDLPLSCEVIDDDTSYDVAVHVPVYALGYAMALDQDYLRLIGYSDSIGIKGDSVCCTIDGLLDCINDSLTSSQIIVQAIKAISDDVSSAAQTTSNFMNRLGLNIGSLTEVGASLASQIQESIGNTALATRDKIGALLDTVGLGSASDEGSTITSISPSSAIIGMTGSSPAAAWASTVDLSIDLANPLSKIGNALKTGIGFVAQGVSKMASFAVAKVKSWTSDAFDVCALADGSGCYDISSSIKIGLVDELPTALQTSILSQYPSTSKIYRAVVETISPQSIRNMFNEHPGQYLKFDLGSLSLFFHMWSDGIHSDYDTIFAQVQIKPVGNDSFTAILPATSDIVTDDQIQSGLLSPNTNLSANELGAIISIGSSKIYGLMMLRRIFSSLCVEAFNAEPSTLYNGSDSSPDHSYNQFIINQAAANYSPINPSKITNLDFVHVLTQWGNSELCQNTVVYGDAMYARASDCSSSIYGNPFYDAFTLVSLFALNNTTINNFGFLPYVWSQSMDSPSFHVKCDAENAANFGRFVTGAAIATAVAISAVIGLRVKKAIKTRAIKLHLKASTAQSNYQKLLMDKKSSRAELRKASKKAYKMTRKTVRYNKLTSGFATSAVGLGKWATGSDSSILEQLSSSGSEQDYSSSILHALKGDITT